VNKWMLVTDRLLIACTLPVDAVVGNLSSVSNRYVRYNVRFRVEDSIWYGVLQHVKYEVSEI
jgi:hypothetical protein